MLVQQLEERIAIGLMYKLLSLELLGHNKLSTNSASKISNTALL